MAQPALAQDKSADTLFKAGREAAKKGEHATACRLFGESYALDPAVGTLLNIARCEEELGKVASASQRYREVMEKSEPSSERYVLAEKRSKLLGPKLAWLTLRLGPGADRSRISIDDKPVASAEIGAAIALDPGEHVVEAVDENGVAMSQRVTLARAERRELEIGAAAKPPEAAPPVPIQKVAPAPAAPVEAPRPPTPVSERREAGQGQRIAGVAVAAGGVVAVVVGAIFWQRGKSKHDQALDHCQPNCDGTARDLQDEAKSSAMIGNVVAIGGTLLLAGGAALYFTAPTTQKNLGGGTVGVFGRW